MRNQKVVGVYACYYIVWDYIGSEVKTKTKPKPGEKMDSKATKIGHCVCGAAVGYDDGFDTYRIESKRGKNFEVAGDEGEEITGDDNCGAGESGGTIYRCPACSAPIGVYIESDGRLYHLVR